MPVPVTPALRRALGQLRTMSTRVRPVPGGDLHTTLRFLGDVDPALVPAIIAAMRSSVGSLPAHRMRCCGVGCFRRGRRGTVIWAGLEEAEPLVAVAAVLNRGLKAIAPSPERKPWTPHVTLARLRGGDPAALPDFLDAWSNQDFGLIPVEEIHLVRSVLRPTGAMHEVMATVPLAGCRGHDDP